MRRKNSLILSVLLLAAGLSSCDDGRIYEKTIVATGEGRTVTVTGQISGIDKWSEDYSVVIAAFNNSSQFAVVSKVLPVPDADGKIDVSMSGITEEVTTVELCVTNKLRKRIVSFAKQDCSANDEDVIEMEVGIVDVGMYRAVQSQVFNANCTACHGGSTSAAGGLYLTDGKSYEALVNKKSQINSDELLVVPGNAKGSFLHQVLNVNGVIKHDHLDILSAKPEMLSLIDSWINNGAQE